MSVAKLGRNVPVGRLEPPRPFHQSGDGDLGGPFHDEQLAQVVAGAEEVPLGRGGVLSTEEEMLCLLYTSLDGQHQIRWHEGCA